MRSNAFLYKSILLKNPGSFYLSVLIKPYSDNRRQSLTVILPECKLKKFTLCRYLRTLRAPIK